MKKTALSKFLSCLSSAVVMASAMPLSSALPSFAADENVIYGDANNDGEVSIDDAVLIMQALANPDKYGINGSDPNHITAEGSNLADVYKRGDDITAMDALSIQKYLLHSIDSLPESWNEGTGPVVPVTEGTLIHLKGASIEVEGDNAVVDGTIVTITHSGSFIVDGTLDDGQINVNIPDEAADPETVKIFLNGVDLTGKSAPAILVENAKNTSLNIMDGTENTISDGDTAYPGGEALIFAKDDITFKGGDENTGKLIVTANTQNAVVCNNDIKFTGGHIEISAKNKTDKTNGVNGKKSVTVKDNAVINIDAEGDGLKSSKGDVSIKDGNVLIKAGNDAIQAETTIDISGGMVIAGGDRGLTAVTGVNITGGSVAATATDNQVDIALLEGTTQGTKLFNMEVCPDSKDGTWKKSYSFGPTDDFTKKYSFVLMSDELFSVGSTSQFSLENEELGSLTLYHEGTDKFKQSAIVTSYDGVTFQKSASGDDPAVDPTPSEDGTYAITLSGTTLLSDAPADTASVSNSSLTIKKPGIFTVSGTGKDVQIIVDVDKTAYPDGVVELDLVGADISNSTTAPIYVANIGDEVQIVAKKGTENVISDGTSHTQTYTDSDGNSSTVEGAIFARDDIKFKGSGSLTVNGNTDDAIVCKNDIKIFNGTLTVNAVDDGIRGKDSVTIGKADDTDFSGLNINVKTQQGDGIKSTSSAAGEGVITINGGTVNVNAYADGIQAEQDVVINGGDLTIYTYQGSSYTGSGSSSTTQPTQPGRPGGGFGGGFGGMQDGNPNKVENSAKGIKAAGIYDSTGTTWQSGGSITINGGNITIDSSDDAVHCAEKMDIKGGVFNIKSADDAFHSDNDLTIGTEGNSNTFTDVQIYISKCYEGIEGAVINQCSGTVYIVSDDDGYNAAGGADSSGSQNTGGWNPGGGFGGMSSSTGTMNLKGGLVVVNSASGDHDAFDSNGDINITGGYYCANGQEPMDCGDNGNSINNNGGNYISMSSGNTNLKTRYTFLDASGKVVVSFLSASGGGSVIKSGSAQSGGTLSGGEAVLEGVLDGNVIVGGTLTGGTNVSAASSSGSNNPWNPRK